METRKGDESVNGLKKGGIISKNLIGVLTLLRRYTRLFLWEKNLKEQTFDLSTVN